MLLSFSFAVTGGERSKILRRADGLMQALIALCDAAYISKQSEVGEVKV